MNTCPKTTPNLVPTALGPGASLGELQLSHPIALSQGQSARMELPDTKKTFGVREEVAVAWGTAEAADSRAGTAGFLWHGAMPPSPPASLGSEACGEGGRDVWVPAARLSRMEQEGKQPGRTRTANLWATREQ